MAAHFSNRMKKILSRISGFIPIPVNFNQARCWMRPPKSTYGGDQRPALCFKRIRLMNRVRRWVASLAESSMEKAKEDWEEFLDPRSEYKFVLRHVLTQKGLAHLAKSDREAFRS